MNARYLWNALKNGAEVHDYAWVDQGLQTQPDIWKIAGGWVVQKYSQTWVQENPVNLREIVRIARNWDEHMWLIPSQEPERDEYWYIPY